MGREGGDGGRGWGDGCGGESLKSLGVFVGGGMQLSRFFGKFGGALWRVGVLGMRKFGDNVLKYLSGDVGWARGCRARGIGLRGGEVKGMFP